MVWLALFFYGQDLYKTHQRRDERKNHNPDKGMERRIHQADRREEKTQSAVSCIERGSKEAEKIRKSVYSILRQEQREQQPRRKQDMER